MCPSFVLSLQRFNRCDSDQPTVVVMEFVVVGSLIGGLDVLALRKQLYNDRHGLCLWLRLVENTPQIITIGC